jgi:ABC-type nitrate/sulfonate/bicarbonate transport system permease component
MKRIGFALLSLLGFLLVWKLVTVVGGYPEFILPAPEVVLERAARAIGSGVLWEHVATTMLEVILGFAFGATAGILIGIALGKSVVIEQVLSPYIVAAQAIPILALAPLLDIWFGGGLLARVAICSLIVFFPIAIATMVGIRSADPLLDELLRSLGASSSQRTRLNEVPAALPVIFGGLRVGVTLAVIGAVVAEWAGASVGLGVLLVAAGVRGRPVLPTRTPHTTNRRSGSTTPTGARRLALVALAGLACWLLTGWLAAGVAVALVLVAAPRLFGAGERKSLIAKTEAIAAWTEMLRDSMAAADGVEQAIEATVAIAPAPIRSHVAMLDAARRSRPLASALREFGRQVDHPSADLVVQALVIAAEGEGTDFAKVLGRLASITRGEVRMRLRVEASRARLRTSARLILGVLVAAVVLIASLSRTYLEPYGTPAGQAVLVIVGGAFAAGCVLLDRMSRIELPERFPPRQRTSPP